MLAVEGLRGGPIAPSYPRCSASVTTHPRQQSSVLARCDALAALPPAPTVEGKRVRGGSLRGEWKSRVGVRYGDEGSAEAIVFGWCPALQQQAEMAAAEMRLERMMLVFATEDADRRLSIRRA